MSPFVIQFALLLVTFICNHVEGKRDAFTYCEACRALVDELQYEIRKVNPSKTIDVGSFRLGPDGKQVQNKVALAKSEVYLTEVLESICDKMDDYSLYYDPKTEEKSFKRFAPRDNEPFPSLDFSNFQFNPTESLKYACERVVEENDEEIHSLVTQEASDFVYKLCTKIAASTQAFVKIFHTLNYRRPKNILKEFQNSKLSNTVRDFGSSVMVGHQSTMDTYQKLFATKKNWTNA